MMALWLHLGGRVFFFLGNRGSMSSHSRSVKLLVYEIFAWLYAISKIPNAFYRFPPMWEWRRNLQKWDAPSGSLVYTDEYDIYARLEPWGYKHQTVCHSAGEYARDEDGDGFCEVHVIPILYEVAQNVWPCSLCLVSVLIFENSVQPHNNLVSTWLRAFGHYCDHGWASIAAFLKRSRRCIWAFLSLSIMREEKAKP